MVLEAFHKNEELALKVSHCHHGLLHFLLSPASSQAKQEKDEKERQKMEKKKQQQKSAATTKTSSEPEIMEVILFPTPFTSITPLSVCVFPVAR